MSSSNAVKRRPPPTASSSVAKTPKISSIATSEPHMDETVDPPDPIVEDEEVPINGQDKKPKHAPHVSMDPPTSIVDTEPFVEPVLLPNDTPSVNEDELNSILESKSLVIPPPPVKKPVAISRLPVAPKESKAVERKEQDAIASHNIIRLNMLRIVNDYLQTHLSVTLNHHKIPFPLDMRLKQNSIDSSGNDISALLKYTNTFNVCMSNLCILTMNDPSIVHGHKFFINRTIMEATQKQQDAPEIVELIKSYLQPLMEKLTKINSHSDHDVDFSSNH